MAAIRHRRVSEDEIEEWSRAFRAALHEMRPHEEFWGGIWREYQGQPTWHENDAAAPFSPMDTYASDRPWINYLFSEAQTIVAGMLPRRPMFTFVPTQREQMGQQRVMGAAGNYFWKRNGSTPRTRQIVLDVLLCGHGIGKTVWDSPDAVNTRHVADYEDGSEGKPGDLAGMDPEVQKAARKLADRDDVPFMEEEALPAMRRVAPWNLFKPAGYADLSDSPWVMERYVVPLEELRDTPKFKIPDEVEADTVVRPIPMPEEKIGNLDAERFTENDSVTVFELHHWVKSRGARRRFTTWFLSPGGKADGLKVIGSIEDPMIMPGWPYDALRFSDVPGSWFSTTVSDLATIRPLATRLNEIIHYVLRNHRLNSRIKLLVAAGIASQEEIENWLEGEGDAEALMTNLDDVRSAFAVMPQLKAPDSTPFAVGLLQQSMREVGTVDSVQRGNAAGADTATEARIADRASRARMGVRQEVFSDWLERVMDKQMAIFRQMSSASQQMRIAGPEGPEFLDFDPQKIQGRFDVQVEASSMEPRNPGAQQEQLISLVSAINLIVQNFTPAVQVGAVPPDIIQNTLKRIFDIYGENPEAFMGPIGDIAGQITDGVRRPASVDATGGQGGGSPQPQPGPPSLSAVGGIGGPNA